MNRISPDFAFLDSGTGGIPYMIALKQKLSGARFVYLGDTAHFPYGEKSQAEVTRCASSVISRLIEKWNPGTIVIACNTISVTALAELRKLFPSLPIVGTVPAIKLAAAVSRNRRIGLLATNATVCHPYCARLIKDFAADCAVFSRGDPELISFVEKNLFTASRDEKLAAVRPAVSFFRARDCDTIVLGCTHFTHIADIISQAAGDQVRIVDSREGVANQALRVSSGTAPRAPSKKNAPLTPADELPADMSFFFTAATEAQIAEYKKMCANLQIPFGGFFN